MSMNSRLLGLPAVLFMESPASWLSRAALSQGVCTRDLLRYVGLPDRSDVDVEFFCRERVVMAACGLAPEDFALARAVMQSLVAIDELRHGEIRMRPNLLNKLGRYRFCPYCLREAATPYFSILSRLEIWRYCPKHWCLLEPTCPHCSKLVVLPFDMTKSSWTRTGLAYLSQCSRCGQSIAAAQPLRFSPSSRLFNAWDHFALGRSKDAFVRLHDAASKGRLPFEIAICFQESHHIGALDGPNAFEPLWRNGGRGHLSDRAVRMRLLQYVAVWPYHASKMSTAWFRREIYEDRGTS
jgi:hypothetical protein